MPAIGWAAGVDRLVLILEALRDLKGDEKEKAGKDDKQGVGIASIVVTDDS